MKEEWRRKCLDGTITRDEYKLAIADLRQGRTLAQTVTKIKVSRKKKVAPKEKLDKGNEGDIQ